VCFKLYLTPKGVHFIIVNSQASTSDSVQKVLAITQACQVELACVLKRSALYVILQSSFVSRLHPPKCLAAMNWLSLKAPVSMYAYLRLIKKCPFHTHFLLQWPPSHDRYTRACELHTPHLHYLMSLGRGMIKRVFIRTAVRYGRCRIFPVTRARQGRYSRSLSLSDY